jgi:hypothetical protein
VKKISNPGLIKRNKRIGTFGQLGGMAVLLIGLAANFLLPTRLDLSYLSLILGFILVSIGSKGLDDSYTIVHFRLGADHALFTPNGILAILAKPERGQISFDGKKWRQDGVSGFMKFFGTEALGNPAADSRFEAESLSRKLRKILETDEAPVVQPIIAFLNPKTRVEADSSPVPALHASKIKEYIRHLPKNPSLRPDQFQQVLEYIGEK